MLFNSYIFILVFLPLVLISYFMLNRFQHPSLAKISVILFSMWFYGYYNPYYLLILCCSIIGNYLLSRAIILNANPCQKKILTGIGILGNISVLFYFKYFNFFIDNINLLFKTSYTFEKILLPLGISFFTFQQLSYLIDSYHNETSSYSFLEYALFVSFFPQLIAGPIVLHDEIIPQFRKAQNLHFNFDNFAHGFYIFTLGLFKKVILADTLGNAVNWGYSNYLDLNSMEVFVISLSYFFQIYFDFSGYCDMATGIARMFSLKLPLNFDAPYQSLSISEFWKRWHISLGRFLTKYIYIPLGGNRKGKCRTYLNLLIVFFISGIWHGANWTYILWGTLHGIAQILNRIFEKGWNKLFRWFRCFCTCGFFLITLIIFKSDSLGQAFYLIKKLFQFDGFSVRPALLGYYDLKEFLFVEKITHIDIISNYTGALNMILLFLISFLIVIFAKPCAKSDFKPTVSRALGIAFLFTWSLFSLSGVSTFLYFGF